jgi:hypothetical protein
MPLNPQTGIDPVVDRFVVKLQSSGQVINLNANWPRGDGGAIVGGNPDYQYFTKLDPEQPPLDHRFDLVTTYAYATITPTPAEGLPVGTYSPVYTVVRRELNELLAQIESAYQEQVRLQFPETENPSTIIQVGGILIKQQSGAVLTTAEVAIRDAFVAITDKVQQLVERRAELMALATADEDYDLTLWPIL